MAHGEVNIAYRMLGHHYKIPRLVKERPKTPLPSSTEDPAWFGELYLQYPLSRALTAMGFGRTFRARAELSVIVNDLGGQLFDKEDSAKNAPQKIIEFIPKLIDWYSALPVELTSGKIVFHFQLKLQ